MPFTVTATNDSKPVSATAASAQQALDAFLDFESKGYTAIAIQDGNGQPMTLDTLSALVEAAED